MVPMHRAGRAGAESAGVRARLGGADGVLVVRVRHGAGLGFTDEASPWLGPRLVETLGARGGRELRPG